MSRKPNPVPTPDHVDPTKIAARLRNAMERSGHLLKDRPDAIARVLGTKKKEDGE
jgi:hypothetical protein